ncbi:MAG TPA: hypothetical protein VIZ58_02965, partial [Thermoanaerobaculia bacterium]
QIHVEKLRQLSPLDGVSYLIQRFETMRFLVSRAFARIGEFAFQPLRRAQRRVREANIRAASRYVPGYYEGKVTIFRAAERRAVTLLDPNLGWGELCGGGVDVYEVPGAHSSILLEDSNLRMLGSKLRECLLEARETERLRSASIGVQDAQAR